MSKRAYRGVLFDLLSALLDSWTLWSGVAGSREKGFAWRNGALRLIRDAGPYRPYDEIVREAAQGAGLPRNRADELFRRWGELRPWPEAPRVLRALSKRASVGVATNSSIALAGAAIRALGVPVRAVVTAEEAGYYKPHPEPYRLALEKIGCEAGSVLFVAGSAADVSGATNAGMDVFWRNPLRLPAPATPGRHVQLSDSLLPLLRKVA